MTFFGLAMLVAACNAGGCSGNDRATLDGWYSTCQVQTVRERAPDACGIIDGYRPHAEWRADGVAIFRGGR